MFSVLKKKNPYGPAAGRVYAALLARTRDSVFYGSFGVPDSFDGRFDLLLLHAFFVVNRLAHEGPQGRSFNQALFDAVFADMDQTLREMGIGDMGIPKHMRRMMKAFNGRMLAYAQGAEGERFAGALLRNLYGTLEKAAPGPAQAMERYAAKVMDSLAAQATEDILQGRVYLPEPEIMEKTGIAA